MARRAMVNEKTSPVGDSRRSSLFDDDFEQENEVETEEKKGPKGNA